MSKKIERLINLLSFFLCHRFLVPWSRIRDEFYGGIKNEDSARRMFERDKEDLRNIGIEIECVDRSVKQEEVKSYDKRLIEIEDVSKLWDETEPLPKGMEFPLHYDGSPRYHIIKENLYLPDVNLSIKEKIALYFLCKIMEKEAGFPLRDPLKMAINKLNYDLPWLDSKDEIETFEKNFTFRLGIRKISEKQIENLKILDEAVVNSKRVKFGYYSIYRDKEAQREVDPYGLMLYGGAWYLVGMCHRSNNVRVFKISRIRDKVRINRVKPKTPDFRVPKEFSIRDFYKKQPWDLGEEEACDVKVRIAPRYVWWVKDKWGDKGRFEVQEDGSGILELRVHNIDAFIRWVLQFGTGIEVLSPQAVREKLKRKMEFILEGVKV